MNADNSPSETAGPAEENMYHDDFSRGKHAPTGRKTGKTCTMFKPNQGKHVPSINKTFLFSNRRINSSPNRTIRILNGPSKNPSDHPGNIPPSTDSPGTSKKSSIPFGLGGKFQSPPLLVDLLFFHPCCFLTSPSSMPPLVC